MHCRRSGLGPSVATARGRFAGGLLLVSEREGSLRRRRSAHMWSGLSAVSQHRRSADVVCGFDMLLTLANCCQPITAAPPGSAWRSATRAPTASAPNQQHMLLFPGPACILQATIASRPMRPARELGPAIVERVTFSPSRPRPRPRSLPPSLLSPPPSSISSAISPSPHLVRVAGAFESTPKPPTASPAAWSCLIICRVRAIRPHHAPHSHLL